MTIIRVLGFKVVVDRIDHLFDLAWGVLKEEVEQVVEVSAKQNILIAPIHVWIVQHIETAFLSRFLLRLLIA